MNGLTAEQGGQFVRELEGELHKSTLSCPQSLIKQSSPILPMTNPLNLFST
jgi:hypothetical protein